MTENEAANDSKSGILTVIGIASILWLLVCIWLFWIAVPCDVTKAGWFARKVTCLASNEMGDSLAGAFAPLAFLWLIAAVFLQRNELAAQRQELRESRAVSSEQVGEARKNVALIEEQTVILKKQREVDEERRADHHVGLLIDVACESAYPFQSNVVFTHMGTAQGVGDIKPTADKAADLKKYIEQLAKIAASAKALHGDSGPVELVDSEQVRELADALKALHHRSDQASAPVKAKVRQLRIRVGRLACDTLLKYSDYGDDEEMMAAIFNDDP